jgi:hypothetical protein
MLIAALVIGMAGTMPAAATTDADRIARGFKIAPVPLKLKGLDRDLVGLGSYIVNSQGGCQDCHTNPPYADGGNPFLGQPKRVNQAGYMGGGAPFGPDLFSANLTPDAQGRPAGLTLAEFVDVMRTGRDPDQPSRLLQVMPWPVYQDMRYDDLKAIYTYLRAIPRIAGRP